MACTWQLRQVQAIYRRCGAISLGESSGKSFEATKYDFPHIRDFLLDRDVTSDVSETATVWSNIMPLYRATMEAIQAATIVPARAMGLDKESGTVEKGKRGDLILINGNPLEDIHNTRNVEYVITNGTMYHTAELWQSAGFKP